MNKNIYLNLLKNFKLNGVLWLKKLTLEQKIQLKIIFILQSED